MPNFLLYCNSSLTQSGIVATILKRYPTANICVALSTNDIIQFVAKERFDLLIFEFSFMGIHLEKLLKLIGSADKVLKILILSFIPERFFAISAYKMGVKGIVHNTQPVSCLLEAIDIILNNSIYYNKEVKILFKISTRTKTQHKNEFRLTKKQLEIFTKLLSGQSIQTIAEDLNLTILKVNFYKREIINKLSLYYYSSTE